MGTMGSMDSVEARRLREAIDDEGWNYGMSWRHHESRGNAAFVAENYLEALSCYTAAIQENGSEPELFVNRAHTLQKLDRYECSAKDADTAISLSPNSAKAHMRKGTALFHLFKYQEALTSFEEADKLTEGKDPGLRQWVVWTREKLEKMNKAKNHESTPGPSETEAAPLGEQPSAGLKDPPALPAASPAVIRHDWYQTESHAYVTILAKNLDPRKVHVVFEEHQVSVKAQLVDGRDYTLDLDLSHAVVPSACAYSVLRSKVELKMAKCEGIRWNSLEGTSGQDKVKHIPSAPIATAIEGPHYPSSSIKRRDWDKIEVEIAKDLAEEKLEGEAALNQLFQKIYCDGSDEVRRAMNKSFQESGGTVLSTNWNDVGKEKLSVKPPDGMEFRKWDQ